MKDLHERYLLLHQSSERLPFHPLLRQKAQGKPDTKVELLSVRKLTSSIEPGDPLFAQKERTDPLCTHTHQATQNGMLMKLGLLKSGHLMNWWKIEWGDSLIAHNERLNHVLLVTARTPIWTKMKVITER